MNALNCQVLFGWINGGRRNRTTFWSVACLLGSLSLFAIATTFADDDDGDDDDAKPAAAFEAVPAGAPVAAPAGRRPNRPGQPGQPGQPQQPAGPSVTVVTIDDKEYKAPTAEFQDAKVTVKSDPPQSVALDDLLKAEFVHDPKLELKWIGQDQRDLVQVGIVDEGNGIRDLHIRASGLKSKSITQVLIVSRPQFRTWRKEVAGSPAWKVAVERIGQASTAELFFEPPTKDLFETELELTFTFDDNSNSKATVKVSDHTADDAKVDPAANTAPRLATVQLGGTDAVKGRFVAGKPEVVTFESAWHPTLELPLTQIRGLLFDNVKLEVKTKYDEKLPKPDESDLVIVLSKDGGITDIVGKVKSISDASLKILYEEQERTIKLERVQAIVFGKSNTPPGWKGPYQAFRLASGDVISGRWQTLAEKTVQIKSAWDVDLEIPRDAVVEITGRNTKMINVSEMTPTTIEQVPYFDRLVAYETDKSWNDRPLRLDDKLYKRGLAVHSRCFLTYDLNGEFATFRAIVGFDEQAGDRGRVVCRVVVDNEERFGKPDFRATEKAVPVEISVKGAKQIRLEVDFGEDQDVGDRVIWANARLYRE